MFDLLVKNARDIRGQKTEIGVSDGKIVAVGPLVEGEARRVLELAPEELVSPGWIDGHVHCFSEMELYHDDPDKVGVEKGVTSVVDAGSAGADCIARFYDLAAAAKTNVYALVNIARTGIIAQNELASLTRVDESALARALRDFPDFAIGIKARMSASVVGGNGVEPLRLAKLFQSHLGVPLMVHIGSNPPELSDVLDMMDEGDILTHAFNGKANGILDARGVVRDSVWAARDRGVAFDLGHGTESFCFDVADAALRQGLRLTSISTDIYVRNRENGPVFDMATTMEKMRCAGYGWPEIIDRVTVAPARQLRLVGKGSLAVGSDADLTIFRIAREPKELVDSSGATRMAQERVIPVKTIVGGVVYDNEL